MNTERIVDLEQQASPQLEGGHLRIANELYDALLRHDLTGRQLKVVMAIMRKTYGYGKKFDDMSAAQLGELCGMARNHVTTTLKQLEASNIISVRPGRYGQVVGINKHYTTWAGHEPASPKSGLVPNRDSGSPKSGLVLVPNRDGDSPEMGHTKDNSNKQLQQPTPKDNPQPQAAGGSTRRTRPAKAMMTAEQEARFDRLWAAYPKRVDKEDARRAWAKLDATDDDLAAMLAALDRARAAGQFADRKFVKHLSTWLNAGCWQDEVQAEYGEAEREVIAAYNDALGEQMGHIDPSIYSESRASQIQDFMGLSPKPRFWIAFFPWVREHCDLPPHAGFDWLISRRGFSAVKGGQHQRSE